jgi:two-component system, OmpR family, response regulator
MPMKQCQSVLYVDDDLDICEVVRASLGLMAGLNVYIAGSGETAIDLAYALRPDLILMDVMMPGLDGPSTLKFMRESPPIDAIPVIFLTAKVLPAEIAHLLDLGAIGVIGKPFDPMTLGEQLLTVWKQSAGLADTSAPARSTPAAVKQQVNSLTGDFLRRTRSDVIRLTEMFEHAGTGDTTVLKGAERLAHSIHGAGAMFGFPQLSATAGAIEQLIGEFLTGPAPQSAGGSARVHLLHCAEQLAREVQMASVNDAPFQERSAGR